MTTSFRRRRSDARRRPLLQVRQLGLLLARLGLGVLGGVPVEVQPRHVGHAALRNLALERSVQRVQRPFVHLERVSRRQSFAARRADVLARARVRPLVRLQVARRVKRAPAPFVRADERPLARVRFSHVDRLLRGVLERAPAPVRARQRARAVRRADARHHVVHDLAPATTNDADG